MSTAETIRNRVMRVRRGDPFTNTRFLRLGSRASVDKTLSRLVEEGVIHRITRGVFMRPKKSKFIGNVMPDVAIDSGAYHAGLLHQWTKPGAQGQQSGRQAKACQPPEALPGWEAPGSGAVCPVVLGEKQRQRQRGRSNS